MMRSTSPLCRRRGACGRSFGTKSQQHREDAYHFATDHAKGAALMHFASGYMYDEDGCQFSVDLELKTLVESNILDLIK